MEKHSPREVTDVITCIFIELRCTTPPTSKTWSWIYFWHIKLDFFFFFKFLVYFFLPEAMILLRMDCGAHEGSRDKLKGRNYFFLCSEERRPCCPLTFLLIWFIIARKHMKQRNLCQWARMFSQSAVSVYNPAHSIASDLSKHALCLQ